MNKKAPKKLVPQTNPSLLSALVCPITGGPLSLSSDKSELISKSAKIAFPIRDGIPIMVQGEARNLNDKELKK